MKLISTQIKKNLVIVASAVLTGFATSAVVSANSPNKLDDAVVVDSQIDLTPLPKHLRSSRYIAHYMKNSQYKKQVLDNEQSALVLDNFIK